MDYQLMRAKGIFVVTIGILELLFFSAVFYGFNALIPAYKALNVYDHLCYTTISNHTLENKDCTKQDNMFGYAIMTWSCFDFSCSFIMGIFFDKFGIRKSKMLAAMCFLIGCLLFSFTSIDYPHFLFPAGLLLGFSCQILIMANLQIGYIFPVYRTIIQGISSGAISCSSLPFTLIYLLYKRGLELRTIFIVYGVLGSTLMLVSSLFLMKSTPLKMIQYGKKIESLRQEIYQIKNQHQMTNSNIELRDENNDVIRIESVEIQLNEDNGTAIEIKEYDEIECMKSLYPTLRSCFISKYYLTQVIFTAFTTLRYTYFFSGLNPLLETSFPNDDKKVTQLLLAFNYISFSGFFVAPMSGVIIDYLRSRIKVDSLPDREIYAKSIKALAFPHIISCSAFIFLSILVFFKSVITIYMSYGLFVIGRTFFLSFININLMLAFPVENFGKLKGATSLMSGTFSTLQYAILKLYNFNDIGGNSLLLAVSFVPLIHPIAIYFIHSKNMNVTEKIPTIPNNVE